MDEGRPDANLLLDPPLAESCVAHLDDAVEEVFTCMLRAVCLVAQDDCAGERICASIRIDGDPAAECAVEVPVAAGDRITDAMLGSEADWDDEMIEDAVGELCNMITGGLKRRLRLGRRSCRISLPQVVRRAAGETLHGDGSAVRRVYCFGDDRIAVTLLLGRDSAGIA